MLTFQRATTTQATTDPTPDPVFVERRAPEVWPRRRVVHVVDDTDPADIAEVAAMTRQLTALGWRVDVVHVGVGSRLQRLRALRELRAAIRRTDPDIVHGHGARGGVWAQLGAAGRRARIVHSPGPLEAIGITLRLSPFTHHAIHQTEAEAAHARSKGLRPLSWSMIDPTEATEATAALYDALTPKVASC